MTTAAEIIQGLSLSSEEYQIRDISCEEYREYEFVSDNPGSRLIYRIDRPQVLVMRNGGATNRVIDAEGVAHCIHFNPHCAVVLRWKNWPEQSSVMF